MYKIVNKCFDKINNVSPILFMSPNFRSFGNTAEEIFYGILLAKKQKKKILFLFPRMGLVSVANRQLFYLEHDNIIHPSNILSFIMGLFFELYVLILWLIDFIKTSKQTKAIFTFFGKKNNSFLIPNHGFVTAHIGKNKLWIPENKDYFSTKAVDELHWKKQYKHYNAPKINNKLKEKCKKQMLTLGLPSRAWYVCIHVRENTNSKQHRHGYIKTYLEAINFVISKGGWVIRIGDADSPELPKLKNFIDVTKSDLKSDILDLYIISECKFFLGCCSGPNSVANMFAKDAYAANITEWSHSISFHKNVIFKYFYSKKKSRILSLREMLNEPFHIQIIENDCHEDYEVIENTPEDIKSLVESAFEKEGSQKVSKKQKIFDDIKTKNLIKHLKQGELKRFSSVINEQQLVQQYRFMAMSKFDGIIEKNFLDKNWEFI